MNEKSQPVKTKIYRAVWKIEFKQDSKQIQNCSFEAHLQHYIFHVEMMMQWSQIIQQIWKGDEIKQILYIPLFQKHFDQFANFFKTEASLNLLKGWCNNSKLLPHLFQNIIKLK